jgi:MoaA/NifB/PqqE/SkfB family radical SAM enzyme
MLDLSQYTPSHRAELERLLQSPEWREAVHGGLLDQVRANRIEPGKTRSYIDTVVDQLLGFNEQRVAGRVSQGEEDEETLSRELGRWPAQLNGKSPVLSFLGLNLTARCNFEPRCVYCNQPYVGSTVGLEGWKSLIAEVTANNENSGPYIYLTGGEPLVLGEQVWGEEGLVRFASQRGAAVNVNTNALLLTPAVALRLIRAGLARLHISLDTADRELQDHLFGSPHFARVLEGIYNVQLARELVDVTYPEIHTNCVLTSENLDLFPSLFGFILEKRKQVTVRTHPLASDLFPHVIPVGGAGNLPIRPRAEGFRRFYADIWPQVCRMWAEHQEQLGVPEDQRRVLFGYFTNPFLRVEHKGGLDAYVRASEEGRYGKLALSRHCYVAPTQASFTPDGFQYRCGSHAIRRLQPLGNLADGGVFDHIREGVAGLSELPQEDHCYGCALATLYINQAVETKLREKVVAMKAGNDHGGTASAAAP